MKRRYFEGEDSVQTPQKKQSSLVTALPLNSFHAQYKGFSTINDNQQIRHNQNLQVKPLEKPLLHIQQSLQVRQWPVT